MKRIFLLFGLSVALIAGCNGNGDSSEEPADSSEPPTTSQIEESSIEDSTQPIVSSQTPSQAVTYYLNTGGSELWGIDNPDFYIYTFTEVDLIQTMGEWPGTKMTAVAGDVYSAVVDGDHDFIIFIRVNPNYDPLLEEGETNKQVWDQTENLSKPTGSNLFTVETWTDGDEGNSSGSWTTYSS
jgi:hypothetical protein